MKARLVESNSASMQDEEGGPLEAPGVGVVKKPAEKGVEISDVALQFGNEDEVGTTWAEIHRLDREDVLSDDEVSGQGVRKP